MASVAERVTRGAGTYAERVARGAALLDEQRPGWWRHGAAIDLAALDINDCSLCILGQLYAAADYASGFDAGRAALGLPSNHDTAWYGFDSNTDNPQWRAECKGLAQEWAALITGRRVPQLGMSGG